MDLTDTHLLQKSVFWRKEERQINPGRVKWHNSTEFRNFNHEKIKDFFGHFFILFFF